MKQLVVLLLLAAPLFGQSEIDKIYDEDQKVREGDFFKQDVAKVMAQDAAHRKRVRELLNSGTLTTGKEFEKAAFVFQHGDAPDDFLFAHILAMVAVKKGNADAIWIAAATLDRYLNKIGQPQVLGTQFHFDNNQPWTMEPYNRELLSDALRRELKVPPLAEQTKQLEEIRKSQAAAAK